MTKLYVEYETSSSGGAAISPGEQWSDHEDTITEFSVVGVSLEKPNMLYYEHFDIDLPNGTEEVYVVHVRYGTGNTFGHETGCGKITDICLTKDDAHKILDSIEDNSHRDSSYWTGYFESLESSDASAFPIRSTSKSMHRKYK